MTATYTLHQGDCLEILPTLEAQSVDAIVCDPPYELSFMSKKWDSTGIAYNVNVWRECLRVLKPGGHLLAFGGTRTSHRMVCAIEDAGFEIRDSILWLYGSGFPKSLSVSKAIDRQAGAEREVIDTIKKTHIGGPQGNEGWDRPSHWNSDGTPKRTMDITAPATPEAQQWDGWGTALKPSHEPICIARKPLAEGTVARNVLKHGTGGINVNGCRIAAEKETGWGGNPSSGYSGGLDQLGQAPRPILGRWPANVLLSHAPGCVQVGTKRVKGTPPAERNESRQRNSGFAMTGGSGGYADADGMETIEEWQCEPDCAVRLLDEQSGELTSGANRPIETPKKNAVYGKFAKGNVNSFEANSGSASRFFYTSKASRSDRNDGVSRNEDGEQNNHTTVKPLDLMRYLCRLVTPPAGTVLDPFMGSGSTGRAALLEGFCFVGVEMDAGYVAIAEDRISKAAQQAAGQFVDKRGTDADFDSLPLFTAE